MLFTFTEFEKGISLESLLKVQNRFIICKYLQFQLDVQSKLVIKVCSLFAILPRALLLPGSFLVNCVLYYRDSLFRY